MEQSQTQESPSAAPEAQIDNKGDDDQFEITGVAEVNQDMANLAIDSPTKNDAHKKESETKLSTQSKAFVKPAAEKPKLAKSNRVFKPKERPQEEEKHLAKLENKGKTFVPKNTEGHKEEYSADGGYGQEQDYQPEYAEGQYDDFENFNYGEPDYLEDDQPEIDDIEDDFLRFQNQTEQLEILKDEIGEFGEGLIRFEESSRDCECCKGLVERCDGEICQTLGECYCVAHNLAKNKA